MVFNSPCILPSVFVTGMWFINDSNINFLWIFYRCFLVFAAPIRTHIILSSFAITVFKRMKILPIYGCVKADLLLGLILMLLPVYYKLATIGLVSRLSDWINLSCLLTNGLLFLLVQLYLQLPRLLLL
jgi:hypothetical protein